MRKYLAIAFVCVVALWTGKALLATQQTQERSKNDLPIVDYDSAKTVDATRRKKSAKFNQSGQGLLIRDAEAVGELLPVMGHWSVGLSAIPAEKSDVVIVGRVVGSKAFISSDDRAVYSEFSIRTETALKGEIADEVAITRYGGAVRFKSGKIQEFRLGNQNTLATGKRYVLFLKQEQEDLSVITGYELANGFVIPLDGSPEVGMVFEKYRGAEEAVFLNEVRDAIAKGGKKDEN